jgi:hypothetical protein
VLEDHNVLIVSNGVVLVLRDHHTKTTFGKLLQEAAKFVGNAEATFTVCTFVHTACSECYMMCRRPL